MAHAKKYNPHWREDLVLTPDGGLKLNSTFFQRDEVKRMRKVASRVAQRAIAQRKERLAREAELAGKRAAG